MTLLHLEILLHYNSYGLDYDKISSNDTRKQYAYDLAKRGLLYTPDNGQFFKITDYGKKKIDEILSYAGGLISL